MQFAIRLDESMGVGCTFALCFDLLFDSRLTVRQIYIYRPNEKLLTEEKLFDQIA